MIYVLLRYHWSVNCTRFFFLLFQLFLPHRVNSVNLLYFNAIVTKTCLPLQTLLNLPLKFFGCQSSQLKIVAISERLLCSQIIFIVKRPLFDLWRLFAEAITGYASGQFDCFIVGGFSSYRE